MSRRALLTGAAGSIGTTLRRGLPAYGWGLRLLDTADLGAATGDEQVVHADVTDPAAMEEAMRGVDAVVHLAAIAGEATFAEILDVNMVGTYVVFDAARRAGVGRIVYASSNHAVGFTPRSALAGVDVPIRPDTYYGVSKVFGEALGSLYADRYGLAVGCLRIGSFLDRPTTRRHLSTWLSPGDMVRLAAAGLAAPDLHFAVVYGISANTRGWWDLTPGRRIGYLPQDDAETYAGEVLAGAPPADPADPAERYLGGDFGGPEYDAAP